MDVFTARQPIFDVEQQVYGLGSSIVAAWKTSIEWADGKF